jgi:uncharacterized membrane protein YdbT with pleckstrin-like domain
MNLNTELKYPSRASWYILTKILLIILLISIILLPAGMEVWRNFFLIIAIFIGVPVIALNLLSYRFISFLLDENKIIINYGIITKKSDAIPFINIQNANCTSGILRRIFGLSRVNIWTASPAQLSMQGKTSRNKPDGTLILLADDAKWLRDYITKK